jgi:glycosyltransferase involved in cell wall biosynthesis
MNIAVIIPTYQRKDGKTPFYLKRALGSVFDQKHIDFKVFLIGDCYDDNKEFELIATQYVGDRLYYINLEKAEERDKYVDNKMVLWSCGGATAFLYGIAKALEQGFDYMCCLDHDDFWSKNHLLVINKVIEETKADWICTKSKYVKRVLPKNLVQEAVVPFLPIPGGVVKSAVCYNQRTIPLYVRDTFEETGKAIPGDSDLWERMAKYIKEKNLRSYLVNELTCFHMEEGYLLRGR